LNLPCGGLTISGKEIALGKAPVISIVDDDEIFLRATSRLVRSLGYGVASFSSAEEFLESDRRNETTCLISDVHMPGMSGLELQNRLLADGSQTPIVFITAFPDAKVRTQALAMGALGFLDKPFNEDQLISYLDQAVATGKG
jgi:FixJ family two-component response regulator